MTTPMYEVEVVCVRCGEEFKDWRRDSINLGLSGEMDQDEIEDQLSVMCPRCGHREFGVGLIVDVGW